LNVDGYDDAVMLLDELLCIKINPAVRRDLLAMRTGLRAGMGLVAADGSRIRRLGQVYGGKLRELREARERARCTNGRRRAGLCKQEVEERVAARERADSELGF
jgi:hypothetical protein